MSILLIDLTQQSGYCLQYLLSFRAVRAVPLRSRNGRQIKVLIDTKPINQIFCQAIISTFSVQ